jgi:hypothetical protein
MKYIVDVDGTICTVTRPYTNVQPLYNRIQQLNRLYDQGHELHYWTARGSSTGQDHSELTRAQLHEWGVKFHSFSVGKPSYDIWIDDKAINAHDFFQDWAQPQDLL